MPAYDAERFEPPAPVAQVVLRNPRNRGQQANALMLLDSGADITLVPRATLASLEVAAVPDKSYELIGFDGRASSATVAVLEMAFAGRTFRGQFLLIEREWGILGRNILNAIPILLDGPNLTWDNYRR